MPIRSRMTGSLNENDLAMLDGVLAKLGHVSNELRELEAAQLIRLFQQGVTDPDELMRRVQMSRQGL